MSFCIYSAGHRLLNLFKKVQDAVSRDIVLFCSTADEGNKSLGAYPAMYEDTTAIACCDANGKVVQESTEYDAQYYIHGTGLVGDSVSYMDRATCTGGDLERLDQRRRL